MSQGGYWAIVTPLMTRKLAQGDVLEIGVHSLYPSKTPILVAVSKVLSIFAIWDAVMITLCLIGLFALRPDFNRSSILYLVALVLAGYLVTSWTFLYPQFNLAQVIKRAKENTLLQIQRESNRLYKRLGKLGNADFGRLKHLMELHESVNRAPNTVISLSGLRSFFGSLIAPTIVAIFGVWNWESMLQKLTSILP